MDITFWKKHIIWAIAVVIILLIAYILTFIEKKIYPKISIKVEKKYALWGSPLIHAIYSPLKLLIWLSAIVFCIQITFISFEKNLPILSIISLHQIVAIICILWFFIRFSKAMEINLSTLSTKKIGNKIIDRTTIRALVQCIRLVFIIIAGLILMQAFGIPLSGVIAFGGFGGIAVGFAAKDLLSNFFGGFMIYLDRPFAIGDWVRSVDHSIEGTIEQIGWRLTRVRTYDRCLLFVPNSIFSTISIENFTRRTNRLIRTNIGIRYDDADKLEDIIKATEEMLKNHEDIDTTKPLYVRFLEFGTSALLYQVNAFTKTPDKLPYLTAQQNVFIKALKIIIDHDARCAYPTTTLDSPDPLSVQLTSK